MHQLTCKLELLLAPGWHDQPNATAFEEFLPVSRLVGDQDYHFACWNSSGFFTIDDVDCTLVHQKVLDVVPAFPPGLAVLKYGGKLSFRRVVHDSVSFLLEKWQQIMKQARLADPGVPSDDHVMSMTVRGRYAKMVKNEASDIKKAITNRELAKFQHIERRIVRQCHDMGIVRRDSSLLPLVEEDGIDVWGCRMGGI